MTTNYREAHEKMRERLIAASTSGDSLDWDALARIDDGGWGLSELRARWEEVCEEIERMNTSKGDWYVD